MVNAPPTAAVAVLKRCITACLHRNIALGVDVRPGRVVKLASGVDFHLGGSPADGLIVHDFVVLFGHIVGAENAVDGDIRDVLAGKLIPQAVNVDVSDSLFGSENARRALESEPVLVALYFIVKLGKRRSRC